MNQIDLSIDSSINIIHGVGELKKYSDKFSRMEYPFLVTTHGFIERGLIKQLFGGRHPLVCSPVLPNPSLDFIQDCLIKFKDKKITEIVGIGGGSVIDVAKILSLALANPSINSVEAFLRDDPDRLWKKLPLVVAPSTCGTGSEVTPFATIWNFSANEKLSCDSEYLQPNEIILDPLLLSSLPHKYVLYSALDTISHALESLWNKKRTPESQKYAVQSLELSLKNLPLILRDPGNLGYLSNLLVASTYAGLAIAITRTAVAHAISYPLTMRFDVPHGLACSFTLENIINQYLKHESSDYVRALMLKISKLLRGLNLADEMSLYLEPKEIGSVPQEEFLNRKRFHNFSGGDMNVIECLLSSLNG